MAAENTLPAVCTLSTLPSGVLGAQLFGWATALANRLCRVHVDLKIYGYEIFSKSHLQKDMSVR